MSTAPVFVGLDVARATRSTWRCARAAKGWSVPHQRFSKAALALMGPGKPSTAVNR